VQSLTSSMKKEGKLPETSQKEERERREETRDKKRANGGKEMSYTRIGGLSTTLDERVGNGRRKMGRQPHRKDKESENWEIG